MADTYQFEQRFVTREAPGGVRLLARALGAALPLPLRPRRCRSTSSCRRGCPTDARVVIFPGGLLPPHAIAGQWGGRYRPRTPAEHLRGLFAADRPDPPLRYLRHYLLPAPWVAEAWREG